MFQQSVVVFLGKKRASDWWRSICRSHCTIMRFKFPVCFQSPSLLCPTPNSFLLIFKNYVVHIVQDALSQLVIYPSPVSWVLLCGHNIHNVIIKLALDVKHSRIHKVQHRWIVNTNKYKVNQLEWNSNEWFISVNFKSWLLIRGQEWHLLFGTISSIAFGTIFWAAMWILYIFP